MKKQPDINVSGSEVDNVRGSNQSGMRARNERLVLTLIRRLGPLAKAELARRTGLSAQTVSVIMRALEADGLLKKGDPVRGKVGQPSVPMDLDAQGAYFLGLKVGRRSLDLILTDFLGNVMNRVHLTHRFPAPDAVVRFANDGITELLSGLNTDQRARVAGLGIAIPFRLWEWTDALGVRQSDMDPWRDRDIRTEIAGNWNFPVFLQNDASSACGAELVFGDKDRPAEFLYFFIGFFIGGGVVLNNTLFTGKTGNAGALGPMPVGRTGQTVTRLMDVASLSSLEQALSDAGENPQAIWDSPEAWPFSPNILDTWINRAADGLASAVVSSVSVIEFECVFIDGWVPDSVRDRLVASTARTLTDMNVAGIIPPEIRAGTIGSDARALGAASLPLSERFLIDQRSF